jgi:hypothetical protein
MMPSGKPAIRRVGPTTTAAADVRLRRLRLRATPGTPEILHQFAPATSSSVTARDVGRQPVLRAFTRRPANAAPDLARPDERVVVLHHNGNTFSVTASMALIFQKNVARVLAAGESELVVLAHLAGVELLLITPITPFHFDAFPPLLAGTKLPNPTPGHTSARTANRIAEARPTRTHLSRPLSPGRSPSRPQNRATPPCTPFLSDSAR